MIQIQSLKFIGGQITKNLLVMAAYLLTAWLGLSVPFEGDKVTLFWLPSGIAVAAIYRWGLGVMPGIYLAALGINLSTGDLFYPNFFIAVGNTLGPAVAAWLFHYWRCNLQQLDKLTALKLMLIALLSMTIAASVGTLTLSISLDFSLEQSIATALVWWMGDSLGVLLCAPLLINLNQDSFKNFSKKPEKPLFIALMILLAGLACFPLNHFGGTSLPIVFITFVGVAWAALSYGLIGGTLSSLCFSFIAIWSTAHQLGPFVFEDLQLSYWIIWIYAVVMTILSLMITAAYREIAETSHQLQTVSKTQEIQQQQLRGLDLALAAVAADSADTPDFYPSLLKSLGDALNAEYLAISLVNENFTKATTHTFLIDGEVQPNITYDLANTPCQEVIEKNFCFVPQDARSLYPKDEMLQQAKIESYLGIIIKNISGSSIGILIALSQHKIDDQPQINLLMRIFSERIAGELRRAEDQEKIFNLAFFDPLTALPNRRLLQDRLKLITEQSERTHQFSAILFIDIDHFKFLNDSRGHHIGDQLLTLVAERIRNTIRSTDIAARLGGDEFVVIFDNLGINAEQAAQEAGKRAEELHQLINLPYTLLDTVHYCTISIGVNLFCGTQISIDDLLRHADLAMYKAKDSGRNSIRFFDPQMQSQMELRASIETDLRSALESSEQLIPYYQIQVNHQGKALGAELLLRWQHPQKGMISPMDFIPIAEQTGLIIPIGRKVLHMACKQLALWHMQTGFENLKLAINVSPIQFNQQEFIQDVLAAIAEYAIDPQQLILELTEGSLLQNMDASIAKMQALKSCKIGFAMDDFGIGYSSLSYLKKLPLNQLKIDQSFVRDISIDPNDRVIVRTIIAMAKNMELDVLAEGVETPEQKQYLIDNGCEKFQGYYFARPLPLAEFEQQRVKFG